MSFLPEPLRLWIEGLPFTAPLGLLLLLLIPLAFLVLLLRRQRLDVGSLLLFRDLPQRVLFQNINLEHLWHRWVYVALFAILALIAAGLSLPQPGQRHLVVLDDSASMAAYADPENPDQGSYWDDAKRRARAAAEQSSALGRAVVLIRLSDFSLIGAEDGEDGSAQNVENGGAAGTSSNAAAVSLSNALERNALAQQLDALGDASVRAIPLSIDERVQALSAFAGAQGAGRITLFTDRPLAVDAAGVRVDPGVRWVDVAGGAPAINIGLVEVQEKQNTFDRDSRVVLQNLSTVPVSDVRLEARSIKNPVSLPLLTGINLAPNERLEFDIDSLRNKAEILGSGPLRLSLHHRADALALDNSVWLVRPSASKMRVAMVQCQGVAPLFERFDSADDLNISYFGDITSLAEASEPISDNPAENDPLSATDDDVFDLNSLGGIEGLEGDNGALGSGFEAFDLVIYDRCEIPPLYEELETNSIVVDVAVNEGGSFDTITEEDSLAVVRVGWQAPASRSPVLSGVRSLIDMPLVSQVVRPLPQAHDVVGLLSDLDPSQVAGESEQDFFAPSDLLQSFVAWGGLKQRYDFDSGLEEPLDRDPNAPKMLYMGFDPHLGCAEDALDERMDGVPLAETLIAEQNGPDDCLALSLLVVNAIEWMRADSDAGLGKTLAQRQYFSTGESVSVLSAARGEALEDDAQASVNRERLVARTLTQGQSGAARRQVDPLSLGSVAEAASQAQVRWPLASDGLFQYSGTRPSFDLSVGLFNAAESRLERGAVVTPIRAKGAAAGAGRQDLVRLLVFVLVALMLLELVIVLVRRRNAKARGGATA